MTTGKQAGTTSSMRLGQWLSPGWVATCAQYVCSEFFSDLVRVLWPCRVSIAVLLGAFFPLVTEQGRELIVGIGQTSSSNKLWILAAQCLWIFLSWFWARLLLNTAFSLDREHERDGGTLANQKRMTCLIDQVPRIIGLLGGLIAAGYWYDANNNDGTEPVVSVVMAFAAYLLFFMRGRACNRNKGPAMLIRLCKWKYFQPQQYVSKTQGYDFTLGFTTGRAAYSCYQ